MPRGLAQGVIDALVANLDIIVGRCVVESATRALVVVLIMAVLSPILAEQGEGDASVIERGFG